MQDFLEEVWQEQEGLATLWWRNEPGRRSPVDRQAWFSYPDEFEALLDKAESLADHDLYFAPALFGQKRRAPEYALTAQVVYADSDTATPDVYRLPPSGITESSKGRYQCFWHLTAPVPAEDASEMSHILAIAHKADGHDPSSWSVNKLLRVPGSVNTSHNGWPEEVTWEHTGAVYDLDEIRAAYADVTIPDKLKPLPKAYVETDFHDIEGLPEYSDVLTKVSAANLKLVMDEPFEGKRSEMRWRLELDLLRQGNLTDDEVLSLCWHAPSTSKWREDPRGFEDGLVPEFYKAKAMVAAERGEGIDPASPSEMSDREVVLMDEEEIDHINTMEHFTYAFVDWTERSLPTVNRALATANAWMALSCIFGTTGYIARGGGKRERLNLFMLQSAPAASLKTDNLDLMMALTDKFYENDPGYFIGSNFSENALAEGLVVRDEKLALTSKDDVHGWFSQIAGESSWQSGIIEFLAMAYGGKVAPNLRTKNASEERKLAHMTFNMHLMGTPEELEKSITRSFITNGFMSRLLFIRSEYIPITDASLEEWDIKDNTSNGVDPFVEEWSLAFRTIVDSFNGSSEIHLDENARERITKAKLDMTAIITGDEAFDLVRPTVLRLGGILRKLASLSALASGRSVVNLDDVLIALSLVERSMADLIWFFGRVSDSEFAREAGAILGWLIPKGTVKRSELMRRFKIPPRDLDGYLAYLLGSGYIGARGETDPEYTYKGDVK